MRKVVPLITAGLVVAVLSNCNADKQTTSGANVQLKTKKDSVSYAIGMDIGGNFKSQSIEFEIKALVAGIQDVVQDKQTKLNEEQIGQIMTAFQQEMQQKMQAKSEEDSKKNKEVGVEFLKANAEKEGVVTLESGLQYKVINEGNGASPTAEQSVSCHYRGTLIDGTEFDSSYKRGEPATFPVSGVIPGWTEALQKMKKGAKWELYVPSDLAYGERGAGQTIGPNATLIFEVELLEIM